VLTQAASRASGIAAPASYAARRIALTCSDRRRGTPSRRVLEARIDLARVVPEDLLEHGDRPAFVSPPSQDVRLV
jgi:hypothetical protein